MVSSGKKKRFRFTQKFIQKDTKDTFLRLMLS